MLQEFENNIGYRFKDKSLLKTALTHTSYAYEKKVTSNEKLEFLGDSILEFISSNFLYENYSKLNEGEMTKVRASVVCEKSLYKIATKHNFGKFLYLGRSEISNNGNKNEAILADSVEAILGGRAEGKVRLRIEALDGLRHDMGSRVAQNVQLFLLRALGDGTVLVDDLHNCTLLLQLHKNANKKCSIPRLQKG